MGISARLFFNVNSEKNTFHKRITPSDEQFDEQADRWNHLAEFLQAQLRLDSGYKTRTRLQGSYLFGTQIRPVRSSEKYDIDLGFYFEWNGKPTDENNSPRALKRIVNKALKRYAQINNDVEGVEKSKTRCERIVYKNGFHIDVPVYHLNEQDVRHLATENDQWENSDPKAFYIWFRELFTTDLRVKIRRIIRYLKVWSALKFENIDERPSSILLTVLVADAVVAIGEERITSDDEAFSEIVAVISERIQKSVVVLNPVNSCEDIGCRYNSRQWNKIKERIYELKGACDYALSQKSEVLSAAAWQQVFEYLFPFPEMDNLQPQISEGSQFLPALGFAPQVEVAAISNINHNNRYSGRNKIGPIPINCSITFRLLNFIELPPTSNVSWTVRNEGPDAEFHNDLGHRSSDGISVQETSKYKGTHYMDCLVRHRGLVISILRIPVTVSGTEGPRRNPLKRPAYTKFRR